MLSASDVEELLEAGAGVKVSGISPEMLIRLAAVARASGGRLEIDARALSPESLHKIAKAGAGHVFFDLTD